MENGVLSFENVRIMYFYIKISRQTLRGTSSYGRAIALHAIGAGIDTPVLHFIIPLNFI